MFAPFQGLLCACCATPVYAAVSTPVAGQVIVGIQRRRADLQKLGIKRPQGVPAAGPTIQPRGCSHAGKKR
jgi:hypothetical protein